MRAYGLRLLLELIGPLYPAQLGFGDEALDGASVAI
jgi:hypothetical protein